MLYTAIPVIFPVRWPLVKASDLIGTTRPGGMCHERQHNNDSDT